MKIKSKLKSADTKLKRVGFFFSLGLFTFLSKNLSAQQQEEKEAVRMGIAMDTLRMRMTIENKSSPNKPIYILGDMGMASPAFFKDGGYFPEPDGSDDKRDFSLHPHGIIEKVSDTKYIYNTDPIYDKCAAIVNSYLDEPIENGTPLELKFCGSYIAIYASEKDYDVSYFVIMNKETEKILYTAIMGLSFYTPDLQNGRFVIYGHHGRIEGIPPVLYEYDLKPDGSGFYQNDVFGNLLPPWEK